MTVLFLYVCWLSLCYLLFLFFFFFKQKTAYEISVRDWSSDVCSSDLHKFRRPPEIACDRARWHPGDALPSLSVAREVGLVCGFGLHQIALAPARSQAGVYGEHLAFAGIGTQD